MITSITGSPADSRGAKKSGRTSTLSGGASSEFSLTHPGYRLQIMSENSRRTSRRSVSSTSSRSVSPAASRPSSQSTSWEKISVQARQESAVATRFRNVPNSDENSRAIRSWRSFGPARRRVTTESTWRGLVGFTM